MSVKLLTEHHLKFLGLTGRGTGSSESTLIKMPHCWKSHVTAHILMHFYILMIAFKLSITITDSAFHLCRYTVPRSGVDNMSHCRSRGRELELGPVPYFRVDRS